jgi:hypothetical protein
MVTILFLWYIYNDVELLVRCVISEIHLKLFNSRVLKCLLNTIVKENIN